MRVGISTTPNGRLLERLTSLVSIVHSGYVTNNNVRITKLKTRASETGPLGQME